MSQRSGRHAGRQRGIAAVELALVLPLMVLLLAFPLFLGRVFWHYTVIQHAVQDAARYLSKAPVSEMSNSTRAIAVAAVADAIIAEELAELAPGAVPYSARISCDVANCVGITKPVTVQVSIQVLVESSFFPAYMSMSIPLTVSITYPFEGI